LDIGDYLKDRFVGEIPLPEHFILCIYIVIDPEFAILSLTGKVAYIDGYPVEARYDVFLLAGYPVPERIRAIL